MRQRQRQRPLPSLSWCTARWALPALSQHTAQHALPSRRAQWSQQINATTTKNRPVPPFGNTTRPRPPREKQQQQQVPTICAAALATKEPPHGQHEKRKHKRNWRLSHTNPRSAPAAPYNLPRHLILIRPCHDQRPRELLPSLLFHFLHYSISTAPLLALTYTLNHVHRFSLNSWFPYIGFFCCCCYCEAVEVTIFTLRGNFNSSIYLSMVPLFNLSGN